MKNTLEELKNLLVKNQFPNFDEVVNSIEIPFVEHKMNEIKNSSLATGNAYVVLQNKLIFFYPINDGMPTMPFEFYQRGCLGIILDNQSCYKEITNLDEILLQMVNLYNYALDNKIVLDPYCFMLRLDGDIKDGYIDKKYNGPATLMITEKAIRNQKLNGKNFDEANKYYINQFLDHFIGWNFGVSVNRNEELKNALLELNDKVIDMGIREYAGTGFEVYGTDKKEYDGLQHYPLPIKKDKSEVVKKIK